MKYSNKYYVPYLTLLRQVFVPNKLFSLNTLTHSLSGTRSFAHSAVQNCERNLMKTERVLFLPASMTRNCATRTIRRACESI